MKKKKKFGRWTRGRLIGTWLLKSPGGVTFEEVPPEYTDENDNPRPTRRGWSTYRDYEEEYVMAITPAELKEVVDQFRHESGEARYIEFVNTIDSKTLEAYCSQHDIAIDKSNSIPYTWPVDSDDAFMDDDEDYGNKLASGTWHLSNGIEIHSIAYANSGLSWIQLYSVPDTEEAIARLNAFKTALDQWRLTRLKREAENKILKVTGYNVSPSSFDKTSWDSVILPQELKNDIQTAVFSFFKSEKVYKELNLSWQRGILLAGAPGNGKTMLCRTIASECDVPFLTLTIDRNTGDGQLNYAFDHARHIAPAILCLEDIDRLFKSNSESTLVFFLNLLDGIHKSNDGVLVIATANHPEDLDQALVQRPSRFDRVFRIETPAMEERLSFLQMKNATKNFFSEECLQWVAKKTHGMSMAFIQEIVTQAHLNAVHAGATPSDKDLKDAYEKLEKQNRTATKAAKQQGEGTVGFGSGF